MQQRRDKTEAATTVTVDPQTSGKPAGRAGCGSFVALKLIMVLSLAGFGLYRAGEAGVGLDVFARQPALAAAAIGVMAHGDFEFVSLDKHRGTLTLRQTETGQTATLRPEQVLRGDVLESGRKIGKLLGPGESASGMPAWVPVYPGAKSQGVVRQDSPGLQKGVASFEVYAAPVAQVADYYAHELRDTGFAVNSLLEPSGATVSGNSLGGTRDVKVVVTARGAITGIRITFADGH